MKSQRGMSYITLIIILIILAFVIAITIHFSKVIIENSKFETYETDMLQIQGKVKILQQEAIMDDNNEDKYVGRKLKDYAEIEEIKKLIEIQMVSTEGDDSDKYYIIDSMDLQKMKLESIKIDSGFFVVNYNTEEVIYSEGIEKENKIYYRLSDMKNIGKEEEKKEETSQEEKGEETQESSEETTEGQTEE